SRTRTRGTRQTEHETRLPPAAFPGGMQVRILTPEWKTLPEKHRLYGRPMKQTTTKKGTEHANHANS
ncbi:MAG TPA: hypothetical protein PLA74_09990, partial [Syntrophales bacterium]|nr:hypothetical protein [Syntrophales bacterium]